MTNQRLTPQELIVKMAEVINTLDTINDLPGMWLGVVTQFLDKADILDINGDQDWPRTLELEMERIHSGR